MSDTTADELAIRNLVARYADAVGRRDEKAWAETWTEDGEWHVLGQPAQGRDKVVALWNQLMGGLPFVVQLPSGGIIEIDGDHGRGRWYITEHGRMADGTGMMNIGHYRDDYRRVDGAWYFARRRFDALYMGPPDLSAEPRPLPADE